MKLKRIEVNETKKESPIKLHLDDMPAAYKKVVGALIKKWGAITRTKSGTRKLHSAIKKYAASLYGDYSLVLYIPYDAKKAPDLIYVDSEKAAYQLALNMDDERPNFLKMIRKGDKLHLTGTAEFSIYGDFKTSELYGDDYRLRDEVKADAVARLTNELHIPL